MAVGFTPALKAARTRLALAADTALVERSLRTFRGPFGFGPSSSLPQHSSAFGFLVYRHEQTFGVRIGQVREASRKVARQDGRGHRMRRLGRRGLRCSEIEQIGTRHFRSAAGHHANRTAM
jgi:hypothetical protein